MARRTWKDRVVEFPRRFKDQNNNILELTPMPGTILEEGTPVNAANLNGLEEDLVLMETGVDEPMYFVAGDQWHRVIPNDDLTNSPGGKKLIAGDMNTGYFGTVPSSELWTGSSLAAAVGISVGTLINDVGEWLKLVLDGKMLFIPKAPIRHGLSWNHINAAGCVFGTKTVSKNGLTYKVRLMKGALTNPALYTNSDRGCKGSEWNRLLLPLHIHSSNNSWAFPNLVENVPNWGINFTDADFGANTWYSWVQETPNDNNAQRICRGGTSMSESNAFGVDGLGGHAWLPVLELV